MLAGETDRRVTHEVRSVGDCFDPARVPGLIAVHQRDQGSASGEDLCFGGGQKADAADRREDAVGIDADGNAALGAGTRFPGGELRLDPHAACRGGAPADGQ